MVRCLLVMTGLVTAFGCGGADDASEVVGSPSSDGMAVNGQLATSGERCWPGQRWDAASWTCEGEPRCSDGFVEVRSRHGGASDCVPANCPRGQARWLVGGPCCWPGQWTISGPSGVDDVCFGTPACPLGSARSGEGCVPAVRWIRFAKGTAPLPSSTEGVISGGPFDMAQFPTTT